MESALKEQVINLLNEKGKSADTMTSALKTIGDGSMENGINKLVQFAEKAGERQGFTKAFVLGVAGTITVAGLIQILIKYIKKRIMDEKKFEVEGKEIIRNLENINEPIEN